MTAEDLKSRESLKEMITKFYEISIDVIVDTYNKMGYVEPHANILKLGNSPSIEMELIPFQYDGDMQRSLYTLKNHLGKLKPIAVVLCIEGVSKFISKEQFKTTEEFKNEIWNVITKPEHKLNDPEYINIINFQCESILSEMFELHIYEIKHNKIDIDKKFLKKIIHPVHKTEKLDDIQAAILRKSIIGNSIVLLDKFI